MESTSPQEIKNPVLKPNNLSVPVSIIIAGTIIAGAIYFSSNQRVATPTTTGINPSQQQAGAQPQQPAAKPVDIAKVDTTGEPFVGNANAPVTVAEWYDYQCPFCKRFESDAVAQLMTDYVKTGKVKLVFKDFQFLGADSQTAGLASRAIWEIAPDKFYDWHNAMFEKQDSENSGWGSKADVLALAKSFGIDSVKVDQLMTSKATEYQKEMDADKAEGSTFGINGTPGTIIGKQLISGAQPYASVKQLIDVALQGK